MFLLFSRLATVFLWTLVFHILPALLFAKTKLDDT